MVNWPRLNTFKKFTRLRVRVSRKASNAKPSAPRTVFDPLYHAGVNAAAANDPSGSYNRNIADGTLQPIANHLEPESASVPHPGTLFNAGLDGKFSAPQAV
jgi:hypothetical protein